MCPVDADATLAALDDLMGRVRDAGPQIAAKSALVIEQAGMSKTHVRSGTLRRSWRVETQGNVAEVGPTTVYARRQELGFLPPLKDSLGRSFPTAVGWPYVRPAFEASTPKVNELAVGMLAEAIGG